MQTQTPQQPDARPDQVRESWDRIAADFDRVATPLTLRLGDDVVARAGVEAGMRVLDVGAGSGALSIPAARRGARVLATDVSPGMIRLLLARAQAEGLVDLDARVMDGCDLDLDDDAFDMAVSQNGVSLFPDVARGLTEMVRVTRPGGSVVVVSFAALEDAEFLTFFAAAMQAVVPGFAGLPRNPPPLPFQLARPGTMRSRLEDAGLSDVRVERAMWDMAFESGAHLWETARSSNPIGAAIVLHLSETQRDEVKSVLDGMLRERSGTAGAVLHCSVNIGIGRK